MKDKKTSCKIVFKRLLELKTLHKNKLEPNSYFKISDISLPQSFLLMQLFQFFFLLRPKTCLLHSGRGSYFLRIKLSTVRQNAFLTPNAF